MTNISTYKIDYNNGYTINITGTLFDAKEIALDRAGYTQEPIYICEVESGEVVAVSDWCEANSDEIDEDNALLVIGNSGYYEEWIDTYFAH